MESLIYLKEPECCCTGASLRDDLHRRRLLRMFLLLVIASDVVIPPARAEMQVCASQDKLRPLGHFRAIF